MRTDKEILVDHKKAIDEIIKNNSLHSLFISIAKSVSLILEVVLDIRRKTNE